LCFAQLKNRGFGLVADVVRHLQTADFDISFPRRRNSYEFRYPRI